MKKYISIILNVFVAFSSFNISFIAPPPVYAESGKISLAIIDFDNNSGLKDWDHMKKGIPEILIGNLVKNKGLKIVERERLDKALKEINFNQSGFVNPETAKKLGKLIGADYALYGSITRFGTNRPTIVISATVMDIQTGEIKFVEGSRGNDPDNIVNLIDKLSLLLLNDLVPSEGNKHQIVIDDPPQEETYTPEKTSDEKTKINNKLVFSAQNKKQPRQIYIAYPDGREEKISESKSDCYSPVWSPDGNKIVYVDGKFGVTVFDLKSNKTIEFSQNPVTDESPKWTKDGRIVFLSKNSNDKYEIIVANKDGSSQEIISPKNANIKSFDVSPQGLVVFSTVIKEEEQIFTINISGDSKNQLTTEGSNFSPVFSPDGKKIAFISDRNDYYKLYVMNTTGNSQTLVTKGEFDEESPVWSPDGKKIAFITVRKKRGKVSVVGADGRNQKILTDDDTDNYDISWLPNSKEISFTSEGIIFTVNIETGNKNELDINSSDKEEPKWIH